MRRLAAFITGAVMLIGAASCSLTSNSSVKKATDSEVKKLIGEWEMEGEDEGGIIAIESESSAWFGAVTDYSSSLHFNSDGSLYWNGETYPKDNYTFSDGYFSLSTPDGNDMSMKKTDGDNNSVYGEYELKGGYLYNILSKAYKARLKTKGEDSTPKDMHLGLEFNDSESELKVKFPANIEIYSDTLFLEMELGSDIESNMNIGSCEYKVVGDTLYITKSDDKKYTLHRRVKMGEDALQRMETQSIDPEDLEGVDIGEYMESERKRLEAELDAERAKREATMDPEIKKALEERSHNG